MDNDEFEEPVGTERAAAAPALGVLVAKDEESDAVAAWLVFMDVEESLQ